jgi:hypothetical protein
MQTIPQSIAAAKGMLVMLLKDGDTIGSWCAVWSAVLALPLVTLFQPLCPTICPTPRVLVGGWLGPRPPGAAAG